MFLCVFVSGAERLEVHFDDLLAFAGCGIAMANASPACRAAADAVTASNDEDGVARGITELLGL